MSGTSLDGIDAALVEVQGSGEADVSAHVRHALTLEYTPERREAIHAAIASGSAASLCTLHAELGEWMADAALRVCAGAGVDPREVAAIGSHGQTVWHRPPADGARGATLQLGDPATL